jgi:hypothetical protein
MKKLNIFLLIVSLLCCFMPPVKADMNQNDLNIITFDLGTTAAGSGTNSNIFRIPQNAKIDNIYIVDLSGVAIDATDTAIITLYLNNSAYGAYSTANGAITAVTPKALTPTATTLKAGDILQFKLTKGGSGKATTNMGVTIAYHNAD